MQQNEPQKATPFHPIVIKTVGTNGLSSPGFLQCASISANTSKANEQPETVAPTICIASTSDSSRSRKQGLMAVICQECQFLSYIKACGTHDCQPRNRSKTPSFPRTKPCFGSTNLTEYKFAASLSAPLSLLHVFPPSPVFKRTPLPPAAQASF